MYGFLSYKALHSAGRSVQVFRSGHVSPSLSSRIGYRRAGYRRENVGASPVTSVYLSAHARVLTRTSNLSPVNMVDAVGYAPGHLGLILPGTPASSEPIGLFGCGKMYLKGTLRDEKQGGVSE